MTVKKTKNIRLIEVPSEVGAGTRGASLGVDAVKIAALDFRSDFFRNTRVLRFLTTTKLFITTLVRAMRSMYVAY